MKAPRILALLCGAHILGAFLCTAQNGVAIFSDNHKDESTTQGAVQTPMPTVAMAPTGTPGVAATTRPAPTWNTTALPPLPASKPGPVAAVAATTAAAPAPTSTSTMATSMSKLYKECALPLLVAGGLVIFSVVLLLCVLALTCRICTLTRRLKELGSREELVSNSGYWSGGTKKDKSRPEGEAKETSMLMADMGNGTAKEEGPAPAAADEEAEQKGDGEAEEEEEAVAAGEAVAVAAAVKTESAPPAEEPSKQIEEAADSPPTETTDAPPAAPQQPTESV